MQEYSLFSHVGVFQDVYIDEERLLMFTHTTQKQSPFLQQAFNMETKVKDHGIVKLTSLFVFPKQTVDKNLSSQCKQHPTIKGEVTDESGRFIACRNIQESQQLVPELSQFTILFPCRNSGSAYNNRAFYYRDVQIMGE